jgi:hypothetical protein
VKYRPEQLLSMKVITTTKGTNLISAGAKVDNIASDFPYPFFTKFKLSCHRVIERHGCFLGTK